MSCNIQIIYIILLVIFIIIVFIKENYNKYNIKENFENNDDKDDEIYSKFYDIIYDFKILYKNNINEIIKFLKINNKIKEPIILDAGCGVGRHYYNITKQYKKVIGIDKTKSLLKYAKIRNINGVFYNENLINKELFNKGFLNYITCLLDTIYHNSYDDMCSIFKNFYTWLSQDGYLFINLIDPSKFDISPREYSQYYFDKNNIKHSLTYFNNFTHDAWFKNNSLFEMFILKNGNSKLKEHKFNIYSIKKMINIIEKHFFKLIDIKNIGLEDYKLYIFKKINIKKK